MENVTDNSAPLHNGGQEQEPKDAPKTSYTWRWIIGLSLTLAVAMGAAFYVLRPMPWPLEAFFTLTSALSLALANLFIPKRNLARIGQLPCMEPDWLTFYGLIFWWVGVYLFVKGYHYPGFMLAAEGGILDVMDGKMAIAMREFNVWRSALCRRIGKWFDPLCDKLKYPPVIILFAAALVLGMKIALWIVFFEVISTLIRNPVNIGARLAWASKKHRLGTGWLQQWSYAIGRRMVRKSKASGFGKIKATIQSLGLLPCVPYYLAWIAEPRGLPNAIYIAALVFGPLSIISRMRIHPAVDRFIDRVGNAGSLFKHRDLRWDDVAAFLKRGLSF